jgi:hypothetical protein
MIINDILSNPFYSLFVSILKRIDDTEYFNDYFNW